MKHRPNQRVQPTSLRAVADERRSAKFMRHLYSTIGLILGFVAVCLAAFESFGIFGPHSKTERVGWQISWSKQSFSFKPKKDETSSQPASAVSVVYNALGLLV